MFYVLLQGPITKTKKIFVGGLASDTKPEDLQSYFETFGKVGGRCLLRVPTLCAHALS